MSTQPIRIIVGVTGASGAVCRAVNADAARDGRRGDPLGDERVGSVEYWNRNTL